jgi:tetratricopeptide (TPR) repeat protein
MPILPESQLIPPSNWEEFENLCFQLFSKLWNDPYIQRNGRKGQSQNGVDIFGKCIDKLTGLQCKGKQVYPQKQVTEKEIDEEVNKAKNFSPKLYSYVILTTAPRDSKIQEYVRIKSQENNQIGLFEIHVFFWEDITERIINYIELIKIFYPHLISQDTEKIDRIDETTQKMNGDLNKLVNKLENYPFIPFAGDIIKELDFKDDIDYSKQLLETYKPETAFDYLNKLKEKIWNKSSSKDKFRIITNMGSAKFNMNLFDEAAELFIQAYEYNQEDEKSLSNLALAYSIKNDIDKVNDIIDKVFKINSESVEAYLLYINFSKLEIDTIISSIPNDILNKPEICNSIGFRYLKEHKYKDSIRYFRKTIEIDKENVPDYKANLAGCLLEAIDSNDIIRIELNIKETLLEVIELYNKALDKIKETELFKFKYPWIFNRGLARKLIGNTIESETDMLLALGYNKNDRIIKHNLSLLYFEQDKNKGIDFLKELVETDNFIEDKLLLSDFYRLNNDYKKGEIILLDLINDNIEDKYKINAYRILENIYEQQGINNKAEEVNLKRLKLNPKDILARIDSAKRSYNDNNIELFTTKLKEASKCLNSDTPFTERIELANALYDNQLMKEAIPIYESFVNQIEDTTNSRRLLNCYYEATKWDKALKLCQNIRRNNDKDISLIKMETYIYEQLGDNQKACELFEEYLRKYNEPEIQLYLGFLYLRMKEDDKLDKLLDDEIIFDNLVLEQRIELAHLYSIRDKRNKFFNLIYETRRKFFDKSAAHSSYVWLMVQRGDKDLNLLNIKSVSNNTVVFLTNGDRNKNYIIDDREDADLSKNEINSKNQLYNKLIEKKINDEVIFETELSKDIMVINNIKSKYIHAFHESMELFNIQFPEDKSFQKVTIENNDVTKVLNILSKNSKEQEITFNQILDYYKKGRITVGIISNYLNKSIIEIWSFLIQDSNLGLINNTGNKNEIHIANSFFNFGKKIIIDQITLNTLVNLKIDKDLLLKVDKFYISQTVIDEINQYKSEIDLFKEQSGFTIIKNGDDFKKIEITPKIKESQLSYLNELLIFVNDFCQIIPLDAEALSKINDYQNFKKTLGVSSINSILLAKQEDGILYSDDFVLRNLAKTEFDINGIWSQFYLQKLFINNILSSDNYYDYVISLSDMNYIHTSINAEIIIHSLKKSNWILTASCIKLLSVLNGNNSDTISAIMVTVDFTFHLWNQMISDTLRDNLLIGLINQLFKFRDIHHTKNLLLIALQNKFRLLPIDFDYISELIKSL